MIKLINIHNKLSALLLKRRETLRNLQSVIGLLNFACRVIRPGRAFLRRLINITMGITKPFHHITITKEVRKDIKTWLHFLSNFSGTTLLIKQIWQNSTHLSLYTDSALRYGFAAVFDHRWAYGKWENSGDYHITLLELYPIVLSVYLWGDLMANTCVLFYSDNQAVVDILNKQSSKDPTIMILVRKFVLLCLKFNILFKLKHVPGVNNTVADMLSRFQISEAQKISSTSGRVYQHPYPNIGRSPEY